MRPAGILSMRDHKNTASPVRIRIRQQPRGAAMREVTGPAVQFRKVLERHLLGDLIPNSCTVHPLMDTIPAEVLRAHSVLPRMQKEGRGLRYRSQRTKCRCKSSTIRSISSTTPGFILKTPGASK